MISLPNIIIGEDGQPTLEFIIWIEDVTDLQIIEGNGSPEGVIEARVNRIYRDTSGTANTILYIKNLSDIGGDTSQGWILT